MKYLLLPALLALAGSASAALSIETISATSQDGTQYRFPKVAGDSAAASNINTWLQAVELHKLPGRYDKVAFEAIWPQGDSHMGVTELDYALVANQPGFLTLTVNGEYTSAGLNDFSNTYSFDTRSGQPLQLADLFSSDGLQWLQQQTLAQRSQRIRNFLDGKGSDPDEALDDDAEAAAQQRELYQQCLQSLPDSSLDYDGLQLSKDQLSLVHDSCGSHADQPIDVLGDFTNRWTFAELREHLSDYGRCLLVEARGDCQRAPGTRTVGVWHGQLDARLPITLVLQRVDADGSLEGSYFYDKFARYIELSGNREQDGSLLLNEDSTPLARMRLKRQGEGFAGSWAQDGKNKTLSVKLD
ncbi:MAG: hypothetical protein GAK45_00718 [Pseudomonas citronellolis]|nr:MAG: hypothetical protein GAK45_00718 [Pseudomonas citronellolis]